MRDLVFNGMYICAIGYDSGIGLLLRKLLNDMQPDFGKELVSACAELRLDTLREPRPFWDDPSSIDGSS